MLTERIAKALALAVEAHDGQKRKGTDIPYVAHPMGVAAIALDYGATEDQAIAALLHDVLEDGGPQFTPVIRERFGETVLAIVEGCTDGVPDAQGKKADWKERKLQYLDHLARASDEIILVSGADKLHNARAIVSDLQSVGLKVFDRFTVGRDGTLWYYRQLAGIFSRRSVPMAKQLDAAVADMEMLAGCSINQQSAGMTRLT